MKLTTEFTNLEKSAVKLTVTIAKKDVEESYNSTVAKYVITTEIEMPRCIKSEELKKLVTVECESIKNPHQAVEKALSAAKENDIICVCGSLYLAGEIRKKWKMG